MLKNIKRIIAGLSLLGLVILPLAGPTAVYAQTDPNPALNCGVQGNIEGGTSTNPNCPSDTTDPGQRLNDLLKLIINLFSVIVGVTAVIMIIIGGLKYITSGGDSGNVTNAKNTILYAIIGLVVVALSQFIVRFVLSRVAP
jgi:hypothetical protein